MGVDRCRFKRRIANVSDVINSVLLKKKSKEHISNLMDASPTTTYSYKIGRHTSVLCSINVISGSAELRGWPKQQKFFVFEI